MLALAAAAFAALSGGVASSILTLRDPFRPAIAGAALAAVAWALARRGERAGLFRPYIGAPGARASRIALLATAAVLVFSIAWSSRAAGGSDSSCYVLQAEAFAHGHATLASPLAAMLPDAPNAVFAPSGFVPSPALGRAVPICAPGLALAMAVAYVVHPSAVFLVVPLAAAALVWLTFVYGRRLDDDVTGACAAVLLAASPIFLYQAVQPMSDVPAAAAWMAALVAASPVSAGVWASAAILIRPNLALLVLPLALLWRKGGSPVFLAAVVPGALVLLALNAARYGSPFATGYGSTDALFARAHVYANLIRYPRWLLATETPFVLLSIGAPWAIRRDPARARLAAISLVAAALLLATYLAYTVFDDWWYIRFLLPMLPLLLGSSIVVLRRATAAFGRRTAAATLVATVAALGAWFVHVAIERQVTDLQRLEARFRLAAELARGSLPADAVFLAVQESGALRFHAGRDTLAWDAVPPAALDAYVLKLRAAGRTPMFALEDDEDPRFRRRFAGQRNGALDWRPVAEIHAPVRVRFYDPLPSQTDPARR